MESDLWSLSPRTAPANIPTTTITVGKAAQLVALR
jgi:hypothetical protein